MKAILKYVLVFVSMILIFLGLLVIVSYIPRENIEKSIKKSVDIIVNEGEEKKAISFPREIYINNSTDAIMLNITYSIDTNNKLESIMKARRNFAFEDKVKRIVPDTVGDLHHENDTYSMTTELYNTVNGIEQNSYEYARYWHGYIVILRPLLVFFNLSQIRIILGLIIIISLLIMLYYIYKNINIKISLIMFMFFLSMDLLAWGSVIQGSIVMIIALITSIFIANKKITDKNINIILFIVAGLTAYFDFFTTPLITFLLPIIIFNLMNNEEKSFKKVIYDFAKSAIIWGLGYALIWGTKWLLIDIMYHTQIIKNAVRQIFYRTGITSKSIIGGNVILIALKNNYLFSANYLNVLMLVLIYFWLFINIDKYGKKYFFTSKKLVYYITAFIPIIWYIVASEHSWQHYHFTYKLCMITFLSMALIVFDNKNIEKKE